MEWLKIQKYLKENFFFTKLTNSKEISDPIVKAVKENKMVKIENAKDIVSPLEDKLANIFSKVEMLKGEKGDKGDSVVGPQGPKGEKGDKGESITGPKGEKGEPGKDGYTPKKGVDYFDGKNGKDGIDGKSITPFEIAEIKREATPKKGIDYYTKKDKKEIVNELKGTVEVKPVSLSLFQRETTMGSIADVNLSNPSNNQVLKYNSTTGKWENGTGGGSGAWGSITGTLSDQTDLQTALDAKAADSAVVHDTGDETIAGVKTFSSDPIIPDEAYGAGWNGSLEPATKNAIYDKIETLPGGHDAVTVTDSSEIDFTLTGQDITASLKNGIAATRIADGSVSDTEFQHLNGVSSNIQTQIDSKVNTEIAIAYAVAL